jgi:isopentenyl phosphate kinase
MTENNLILLKLGGSLITDKSQPLTPRLDHISRIASEISGALNKTSDMQLILGHGSGSFGHAVASQHNTQNGGTTRDYWQGFAEVWKAARDLNQILIEHLANAGLPVIAFPPSAGVIAREAELLNWDIQPIRHALSHNLIPVVQGDVIFDEVLGGTIFSTEQIFLHLTKELQPKSILLAGQDPGVYRDLERKQSIIPKITSKSFNSILPSLTGAETLDVTGGMAGKIRWALSLVKSTPGLEVQVFSGVVPGQVKKALLGGKFGTQITE